MSKKSTNYELLRILLTLFIPIYHWILYNGLFYAPDSLNSVLSLIIFTGVPFSCLYAFIAMSSYFLVKKKYSWSLKKILIFAALAITLFVFKYVFIHVLYMGVDMYSFIYDFFIHGAWWYVYPYVLLMIVYPLLNRFIYRSRMGVLYIATLLSGIWFIINSYHNDTRFGNDCVMFLFIYLLMGCLERHKEQRDFYKTHKNIILISVYVLGVVIFTGLCIYYKIFATTLSDLEVEKIIQLLHGRYNMFGLICGIVIFTLFRGIEVPYKPIIHKMSKLTLYVFLLHETVMSVFWRYEIKGVEELAYLPVWQYFLLIIIYMILCISVAFLANKTYDKFAAPLWEKVITRLCETGLVKRLENSYTKLMEK